jgi:hypothetical protein
MSGRGASPLRLGRTIIPNSCESPAGVRDNIARRLIGREDWQFETVQRKYVSWDYARRTNWIELANPRNGRKAHGQRVWPAGAWRKIR